MTAAAAPAAPQDDVLARICADKRRHVTARKAAVTDHALAGAARAAGPVRGFAAALGRAAAAGTGLIAEIKRASPSRGVIRADFDPPTLARAYASAGAACLSVLTDRPWFQGDDAYLGAARDACTLPVLRKDFLIDPWQVVEARALGADAVLVILAAVDDATACALVETALAWGMDVLAEVHDAAELDRALVLPGTPMIGINNRNLKTLTVDLATTERLAPLVPPGRLVVGESGIDSRADLDRLALVGVRAVLVGESLMRRDDVAAATRRLLTGAA